MAEIKKLNESHTQQIANLEKMCFSDPWTENMVRDSFYYPNAEIWGVFEDNNLVGYYASGQVADEGELMSICVLPEHRGKGYGRLLISHMEDTLRAKGTERIFLEVRESNKAARSLYKSRLFAEMGLRKGYYQDNGENAIIMMKLFTQEG